MTEYIEKIQNQLIEKLLSQNKNVFKTIEGEYKIIKIEQVEFDKLYINQEKIHNLFSQYGCSISGTILVKAQAYSLNLDRIEHVSRVFEVVFNSTVIKFNFEDVTFSIEEDVKINFISLSDRRF